MDIFETQHHILLLL